MSDNIFTDTNAQEILRKNLACGIDLRRLTLPQSAAGVKFPWPKERISSPAFQKKHFVFWAEERTNGAVLINIKLLVKYLPRLFSTDTDDCVGADFKFTQEVCTRGWYAWYLDTFPGTEGQQGLEQQSRILDGLEYEPAPAIVVILGGLLYYQFHGKFPAVDIPFKCTDTTSPQYRIIVTFEEQLIKTEEVRDEEPGYGLAVYMMRKG